MQLIRIDSHKHVSTFIKKLILYNDLSFNKLTTLSEVSGILTDFTQTSTPAV